MRGCGSSLEDRSAREHHSTLASSVVMASRCEESASPLAELRNKGKKDRHHNVQLPGVADDKVVVLDVRARDSAGRWLDIEMEVTVFMGLLQRLVHYACTMYVDQLDSRPEFCRSAVRDLDLLA
jgi:hypothetical protein